MAECYLLVVFLVFSIKAETFPNCQKKFTCKSLLHLKYRVDGMFGKLEELSMTQYKLSTVERHLLLDKKSLSTCKEGIQQLRKQFDNLKNPGRLDNAIFDFNQSLIRVQDKNNLLGNKLKELEEKITLDITEKLKEHETSDKNGVRNLSDIRAQVENIEEKNRINFNNLVRDIRDKVNKSEFFQLKSKVNDEIQSLRDSLKKLEGSEKNFSLQKRKIIQEQSKLISSISDLTQQIARLRNDLEETKKEQNIRFSSLQNSLNDIKELASRKRQADSTFTSDKDFESALNKGIDLLKQSGGQQTSSNSSSSKSEESFSVRRKP